MEKTKQLIETLGKTGFEDSAHFSPNVFDNDVLSKVRKKQKNLLFLMKKMSV